MTTAPLTSFIPLLFVKTAFALLTAFVLGGVIGLERQWRQRTAGLRTNVLVAVGRAAFVDLGMRVAGPDGSVRVISYVVLGIEFLKAGVIIKQDAEIRGINTALCAGEYETSTSDLALSSRLATRESRSGAGKSELSPYPFASRLPRNGSAELPSFGGS